MAPAVPSSGRCGAMDVLSFLFVIATGILTVLVSLALDRLWARVLPVRALYYLLRAPGVAVHECSHVLGCIITGAAIKKVVLFSREGGSVTYTRPKLPILGDVIISMAPLFCIPLIISGLSWGFAAYLGCVFPAFPDTLATTDAVASLGSAIVTLFSGNLVVAFHPVFLLWLYLTLSLVLSLAPSMQDLRNAVLGIAAIAVAGIAIIASGIGWVTDILWLATRVIGQGLTLGLVFGLVALVISLPPLAWYLWIHRPPGG